jgi:enoyl-CoA hydratase
MAEDVAHYQLRDRVAVVHLDDGKANAFSHAMIEGLHGALDRAEQEAAAALLVGRPGRFSGGFDLTVMRSGADAIRDLVTAGAELFLRVFAFPQPLVVACTGHAVAAGTMPLLCADARIGTEGEFKIGLNEVGIGMPLPIFAVEFARHRLSKRHFDRATAQARLYAPEEAIDAGYLDRLARPEALFETAFGEAARLAELPQPAFRDTKARARAASLAYIRETLDEDMRRTTRGPAQ